MAKKNKENKYYSVRRYWRMCDVVVVKANSAKEANKKVMGMPLSPLREIVPNSITNDPSVDITEF